MDLHDYFDVNTVSLEVMEAYEAYCSEDTAQISPQNCVEAKKTALCAVREELSEAYQDEREMMIQLWMGVYWCGLQNGFTDETSRQELEALTLDGLMEVFGEVDGQCVYEVLTQLLVEKLTKPEREDATCMKCTASVRKWEAGDVYAVRLDGPSACSNGLKGRYVIFYCIGDSVYMKGKNVYMLLSRSCRLPKIRPDMTGEADFLPAAAPQRTGFFVPGAHVLKDPNPENLLYRYVITKMNRVGPADTLLYCGKHEMITPIHETVPPNDMFHCIILWDMLDQTVVNQYRFMKKFLLGK